MRHQPQTHLHVNRAARLLAAMLLCAGGVSAVLAGQVGVQANVGVTGLASTPAPAFSGATWQDGVVTPISAPVGVFAYSVDFPGATSAAVNLALDVSVPPAPQQPPVPLPGWATSSADLVGGRMGVAASTSFTPVTEPSGAVVSAFTAARVGAELGTGFDLVLPWSGGPAPTVPVTLRLTLSGTVTDLANDASISLLSTLRLSNVATAPGAPVAGTLQAVNSFSTSLAGQTISLTGNLLSPTCSTTYGVCFWYLGIYASIEGFGQISLGPSSVEAIAAGDGLDFTDGARIELLVPAGAVVTDGLTGGSYGWVTAVPEPSTVALMGLGLAGLGLAAKRRRRV